ncbi:hypothetical protein G9A89_009201 [Geosiphon pyriformis]|nr:hypothetical protein G9A89_009201 [Geosiphon pyriformis]
MTKFLNFVTVFLVISIQLQFIGVFASTCDPKVFTPTSVPLKPIATELPAGGNITVGGTVTITDGCTFTVTRFSYYSASPLTYWYGSNYTNEGEYAWAVVDAVVSQFVEAPLVIYKLKSNTSFTDFSVLKLISDQDKIVIAIANLRAAPASAGKNENGGKSGDVNSSIGSSNGTSGYRLKNLGIFEGLSIGFITIFVVAFSL